MTEYRQLDKKEKELTLKGIVKLKEELGDLERARGIYTARAIYLRAKRDYETLALPFQTKNEIKDNEKTLAEINQQLKDKTYSIEEMNKHLTIGVEVKVQKASNLAN